MPSDDYLGPKTILSRQHERCANFRKSSTKLLWGEDIVSGQVESSVSVRWGKKRPMSFCEHEMRLLFFLSHLSASCFLWLLFHASFAELLIDSVYRKFLATI